ncbi:MAG: hypothetical protein RBT76_09295 [candidate division Zixibacteria bacterium]|jgi:hypothetical protein|nr:hypothetical protein [candidate division Zixibacteria bacterium]
MATRTKYLPASRRSGSARSSASAPQTGVRRFKRAVMGYVWFMLATVGGTVYLQSSLILYHAADIFVHWGTILLVIPLAVGYVMRLAKVPYVGWVLLIGAMSAATVVYPWYFDYWAEPPPLWTAIVFTTITAGVASIPLLPYKRLAEAIWHYLTYRKSAKRRTSSSSGREPVFGSAKYSATVDTLQLVIAIASLLISLISIGVLSMP